MKFWLIFMILWALVMTVYALAATISLGEDVEKAEKKKAWLESELEAKNRRLADVLSIQNDPHCRIVGFCEECKKAVYSESLHTYLCGIEEKNNKDYCSDFDNKWE